MKKQKEMFGRARARATSPHASPAAHLSLKYNIIIIHRRYTNTMIIITIIIIINYYRSIKIFISYINRLFLEQYMFFLYLSVLKQIIKNLSVNVKKKNNKKKQTKSSGWFSTLTLSNDPFLSLFGFDGG